MGSLTRRTSPLIIALFTVGCANLTDPTRSTDSPGQASDTGGGSLMKPSARLPETLPDCQKRKSHCRRPPSGTESAGDTVSRGMIMSGFWQKNGDTPK